MKGWTALRSHIAAHPVTGTPDRMRRAFDALACAVPPPQTVTLGGVPCGRHPGVGPPIVWFHGGGHVFGSSASHAPGAAALARLTRRPVITPDHRLAPEHVWPAQKDDALAVLDALPEAAVVGDSAGGQLALIAALHRPVTKLALISPNTDRTGLSTTRASHSTSDLMNDDAQDAALGRMAFPRPDAEASPLLADLTGLPPTWITASTQEVLLDDSLLLIRALGLAGVPVTAEIRDVPCHMWTLWPEATHEAQRSYESLAAFLA